jgi:hypothetical protein
LFLLGGDQKLWFWGLNIFALWQSKMVFWVRCFCFGGEQLLFFMVENLCSMLIVRVEYLVLDSVIGNSCS